MGAGGGRHGHCYTEVHIPPTPHMGVQRLNTLPEQSSPVLNQEEANRRFTITLKPGQYRVNVQWKSKSQPFRITLAPREKSPSISTEGPPPLEQQPLFYCAQTSSFEQPVETHAQSQSQSAPSNISSLPKRLVHRLLYRPTSSTSPFQQCLHSSQNSSYSLQPNVSQSLYNRQSKSQKDVKTKRLSEIPNQPTVLQAPPNSPNCSCRKGQKRGWDGGPKHRSRKSRYRWGSLSCIPINNLDESIGEASGYDSFSGYEGVEHLKRNSLTRRHSLNHSDLNNSRETKHTIQYKSIIWKKLKSSLTSNDNNNIDNIPTASTSGSKCNACKLGKGDGNSNIKSKDNKEHCLSTKSNFSFVKQNSFRPPKNSKESKSVPHSPTSASERTVQELIEKQSHSLSCSVLLPGGSTDQALTLDTYKSNKNVKHKPLGAIQERKTWHEDEAFAKQIIDEYFNDTLPESEDHKDKKPSVHNANNSPLPDILKPIKPNTDFDKRKMTRESRSESINKTEEISISALSDISTLSLMSTNKQGIFRNLLSPLTEGSSCVSVDDTYCDSDDSASWYTDDSLGYEADSEPSDKETNGLLFWRQWRSAPDISADSSNYTFSADIESANSFSCYTTSSRGNTMNSRIFGHRAPKKSSSVDDYTKLLNTKFVYKNDCVYNSVDDCGSDVNKSKRNSKCKKKSKINRKKTNDAKDNDFSSIENLEFVNAKYRPGFQNKSCPKIVRDFMESVANYSEVGSEDGTLDKTSNILSHGLVVTHSGFSPSTAHLVSMNNKHYSSNNDENYSSYSDSSDSDYYNSNYVFSTPKDQWNNSFSHLKNYIVYNSKANQQVTDESDDFYGPSTEGSIWTNTSSIIGNYKIYNKGENRATSTCDNCSDYQSFSRSKNKSLKNDKKYQESILVTPSSNFTRKSRSKTEYNSKNVELRSKDKCNNNKDKDNKNKDKIDKPTESNSYSSKDKSNKQSKMNCKLNKNQGDTNQSKTSNIQSMVFKNDNLPVIAHPKRCKVNSPRGVYPAEDTFVSSELSECQDKVCARSNFCCRSRRDISVNNGCDSAICNSLASKNMAKVNITINLSSNANKSGHNVNQELLNNYSLPLDNNDSCSTNYCFNTYENIQTVSSANPQKNYYSTCDIPVEQVRFTPCSTSSDQGIGEGTPSSGLGNDIFQSHDDSSSSGRNDLRRVRNNQMSKNDNRNYRNLFNVSDQDTNVNTTRCYSGLNYTSSSDCDFSPNQSRINKKHLPNNNQPSNNNADYSVHKIQVGTDGRKKCIQTQKSVSEIADRNSNSANDVIKSELVLNPSITSKVKPSYSSLNRQIISQDDCCLSEYKIGDANIYYNSSNENIHPSEYRKSYVKSDECDNQIKSPKSNRKNRSKTKLKPHKYFSGILDVLSGRAGTPDTKKSDNSKMSRRGDSKSNGSKKPNNTSNQDNEDSKFSSELFLSRLNVPNKCKNNVSDSSSSNASSPTEHITSSPNRLVNVEGNVGEVEVPQRRSSSISPVETRPLRANSDTPPSSSSPITNVHFSTRKDKLKDNDKDDLTFIPSKPISWSSEVIEASYSIPLKSLQRAKPETETASYTVYTSNDSSDNNSVSGIYENMVFHNSHSFIKQPAETVSYTINLSSANSSSGSSSSSTNNSCSNCDRSNSHSRPSSNSSLSSFRDMSNSNDRLRTNSSISTNSNTSSALDNSSLCPDPSPSNFVNNSPVIQDSPSFSYNSSSSPSSSSTKSNSLIIEVSCDSSSSTDSQFVYTTIENPEPPKKSPAQSHKNRKGYVYIDDDDDEDDSDFSSERLSCCRSASSVSLASNASSFYYTAVLDPACDASAASTKYFSVKEDICEKSKSRPEKKESTTTTDRSNNKPVSDNYPIASSESEDYLEDTQYVNANVCVVNDQIVVTVKPEGNDIQSNTQPSLSSTKEHSRSLPNVCKSKLRSGVKSDPTIEERLPPIGLFRKKDKITNRDGKSETQSPFSFRKFDIEMPPFASFRRKSSPVRDRPFGISRSQSEKFREEGKPPAGDSKRGRLYGRRRSTESAGSRLGGLAHAVPCMVVTDSDNRSSVSSISGEYADLPPKPPPSPHQSDSKLTSNLSSPDTDKRSTSNDYYNVRSTHFSRLNSDHLYENTKRNYDIRRTRSEEKVRDRNSFGLFCDIELSDEELFDKSNPNLWNSRDDCADLDSLSESLDGLNCGISREFCRAQKGSVYASTTSLNSQASDRTIDDDTELYGTENDPDYANIEDWNTHCSIWDKHHLDVPLQPYDVGDSNPWRCQRSESNTVLSSPYDEFVSSNVPSPYHRHSPSPDYFAGAYTGPEQSPTRGKPPRSPSHRGRDTSSVPREGGGRPSPRPRSASRRRSRSASSAAKCKVELDVPVKPRPRPASLASLATPNKAVHVGKNSQESLFEARPSLLKLSPVNDVAPDPLWLAERKKSEGNELYKKKDYREALKLYSKAIEICPDCAAYYSNRSACNMMLGRYNDALADALQAVKLDSTMIKGYIRVGKCHVALGDATAALSILKQASELEPANQSIRDEMNSAQTLLRHQDDITKAIDKKDFRTAIFHLDRALEVAVGCVNLKIVKAENLAFLGRYQEAQVIVNEILQFVSSNNADAIYVRGLCLYYQENQDSAFNHFQQVLRLAPDHQKAKEAYKKAKSLKLKKDEGNKAYVSGNLSEAYSLYTEALGIDVNNKSTNSKLYFNRATVASKLNKMEEAVNDCTAAINLDDGYVKAYLRRAKCYQALEQHEEAVRDFEKVFKLDHNQENKRLLQDAKTQLKISKQKDYYKILGVSKTAGEDEIKKSYRKKALVHHPDRHANSSEKEKRENEVKFKEIGEAYAILTDPKKRAAYDRGQDVNDLDSTYCNADEIFAQFFGNSQHFGGFHSPEGFPGRGGGFGGDGFPGGFHFQFN